MTKRILRLAMITVGSMVLSILTAALLMYFFFGNIPFAGLVIAGLVPILAGLPITFLIDSHRRRLHDALSELEHAHKQLAELNLELEKQARFDYLTGFLNRRYFVEAVTSHLQQNQPATMFCIDLDDFKQINDRFGHLAGDAALKLISRTISQVAPEDALIARMGGEEFALFFHGGSFVKAYQAAEAVRTAIECLTFEPSEEAKHNLSVSIGVAFSSGTRDFETLFAEADHFMYDAKNKGKNRIVMPEPDRLEQVA